ncbi:MAG: cytochrome P450 [Actinomycetota bacterium]
MDPAPDPDPDQAPAPDLTAPALNQDPAAFARRVIGHGEVQWSDRHRAWLLLSHAAVGAGFRDGRLSADRIQPLQRLARERPEHFGRAVELLSGWMIFRDPPAHTHLRDPVRRAMTPRVVDGVRADVVELVDDLIDQLPETGEVDFRTVFAEPLPAQVIAAFLGVPPSERHRFKAWSDGLAEIVFSVRPNAVDGDTVSEAVDEFTAFFTELIDLRRRRPGDDLVSTMVAGGADALTAMELVGACTLLLFAGHETTTNMLVSAVKLLDEHPDQRRRLIEDEAVTTTAADELLRVGGPAKAMVRRVGPIGFELDGHLLEPGDKVFLVILTANHDPSVFERPERLDLGRDPNPHLGFGWGLHHCLGAPLARLELTVALRALYRARPALRPADPAQPWSGNELGRGIGRMAVVVG